MKKITQILLAFVLICSMPCTASAETDGDFQEALLENDIPLSGTVTLPLTPEIQPYANTSCTLTFKKTAAARARAQAAATRPGASSVKSTIQLQQKSGDAYVNTAASPAVKTVSGNRISHVCSFSVSKSRAYRIKVTIRYTQSGVSHTSRYYRALSKNGF